MKLFQSMHMAEGVKIALIVVALYGTIALITYLAW
jgi:hypothetical protein